MMNRSLTLIMLAGTALGLSACVGTDAGMNQTNFDTPLSRYVLQVEPNYDRIALAVRDGPLSDAQQQAIVSLARRYMIDRSNSLVIEVPQGNDPVALRSAGNVRAALEAAGVAPQMITYASYVAPDSRAPVVAGFTTVRASVPDCGTHWSNLSRTGENNGYSNFGCAVNANLAAQIADPRDIVSPRAITPPNAQRRTVVFDAYRQGKRTAAERETVIENSRISEAVN